MSNVQQGMSNSEVLNPFARSIMISCHAMQKFRPDSKQQYQAFPYLDIRHSMFEIGNSNKSWTFFSTKVDKNLSIKPLEMQ